MAATPELPKEPHPTAAALKTKGDAKSGLKGVDVNEKISLPDAETIAKEKREIEIRKSIESEDKRASLQHVNTVEKGSLPNKEDIEREKTEKNLMGQIESPQNLKHVKPEVKNQLPDKATIQAEKATQKK